MAWSGGGSVPPMEPHAAKSRREGRRCLRNGKASRKGDGSRQGGGRKVGEGVPRGWGCPVKTWALE